MVIQVYALMSNAGEAEVERFYEDLQDLLELIPKKVSPLLPVLPGICTMDPDMLLGPRRYTEAFPTLTLALLP